MELKTVSQVSKTYGVSTRMLRYYEEIGLLQSLRKEDYSYRVYDEDMLKRLQQIIILRKLQIPVKKISAILNNPESAMIIDIFKKNISDMEKEISALSTIKFILEKFVSDIEKITAVHLKLDLLNDDSVQKMADSLSLVQKNIKESFNMDQLNQASEHLNKLAEENVRIIYRPPAIIASIRYNGGDAVKDEKARKDAEAVVQKFIKDVDLFKIKPDTRVFGFAHGNGYGGWEIWTNIPDNLDIPDPLTKMTYAGGLYAASANPDFDLVQWVENSDKYEWEPHSPGGEEYINPFNILELKNIESETGGSMYTEHLIPVKEIDILTEEQKEKINAELVRISESASCGNSVDVELTTMIQEGEFDELRFADGMMIMKVDGYEGKGKMTTPQQFKVPLKIELRAKTDSTDITLLYAKGDMCLDNKQLRNKLFIKDIVDEKMYFLNKRGMHPVDEFIDIEWIIGREMMVVKVNGEIRHAGSDYGYIKAFEENSNLNLSSAVSVLTCCWATVTVKSLRITEL